MRPAGDSRAGSDYILLPSRGTLARAILRFWSGAITGLDGAGRKVFAAGFANFLILNCWGRACWRFARGLAGAGDGSLPCLVRIHGFEIGDNLFWLRLLEFH